MKFRLAAKAKKLLARNTCLQAHLSLLANFLAKVEIGFYTGQGTEPIFVELPLAERSPLKFLASAGAE